MEWKLIIQSTPSCRTPRFMKDSSKWLLAKRDNFPNFEIFLKKKRFLDLFLMNLTSMHRFNHLKTYVPVLFSYRPSRTQLQQWISSALRLVTLTI